MNLRLQIIIIALMALFIMIVIKKLHSKQLDYKFGLLWIAGAFGIIILAAFPGILEYMSDLMGVETPVNLLFFLGLLLSFFVVFQLGGNVSKQNAKIKSLTQEIGILKHLLSQSDKNPKD